MMNANKLASESCEIGSIGGLSGYFHITVEVWEFKGAYRVSINEHARKTCGTDHCSFVCAAGENVFDTIQKAEERARCVGMKLDVLIECISRVEDSLFFWGWRNEGDD